MTIYSQYAQECRAILEKMKRIMDLPIEEFHNSFNANEKFVLEDTGYNLFGYGLIESDGEDGINFDKIIDLKVEDIIVKDSIVEKEIYFLNEGMKQVVTLESGKVEISESCSFFNATEVSFCWAESNMRKNKNNFKKIFKAFKKAMNVSIRNALKENTEYLIFSGETATHYKLYYKSLKSAGIPFEIISDSFVVKRIFFK